MFINTSDPEGSYVCDCWTLKVTVAMLNGGFHAVMLFVACYNGTDAAYNFI